MPVTKSNLLFAITSGANPPLLKFVEMLEIAASQSKYHMDTFDNSNCFTKLHPGISKREQKESIETLVKYHVLVPSGEYKYYINPYFIYGNYEKEKRIVEELVFKRIILNNLKALKSAY